MSREIVVPSGEVISRPNRSGLFVWGLAAIVGVLVASAVVIVFALIEYGQFLAFHSASGRMVTRLIETPWWGRLIAPLVGGAIIAVLLRVGVAFGWGRAPRAYGLQEVILNRRLRGTIRSTTLTLRDGFLSILISIVSLSWGGSAGREEPVTHLGATLAVLNGRLLGLDVASRRMLVGMGVAAAIAAAMHAPIAGLFLAREMVLRRQRLSSLGPVAIASVAAWLMAMWLTNGRPIIELPAPGPVSPQLHLAALVALPVFIGATHACIIAWTRVPMMTTTTATKLGVPLWLLPVGGGLLLGVIAMAFPQVLGIGYEVLATGVSGNYGAGLMAVLALAKIAATAVTLAFRWGGGVIAPTLFIGGMLGAALAPLAGLALGVPAPQAFMGAVGMAVCVAIVLDAPLTGAIFALELTGSTDVGASALFCCFLACLAARRLGAPPPQEASQTLRWR